MLLAVRCGQLPAFWFECRATAHLQDADTAQTPLLCAGSISAQFLHAQLQYLQHHVEPKGVDRWA